MFISIKRRTFPKSSRGALTIIGVAIIIKFRKGALSISVKIRIRIIIDFGKGSPRSAKIGVMVHFRKGALRSAKRGSIVDPRTIKVGIIIKFGV